MRRGLQHRHQEAIEVPEPLIPVNRREFLIGTAAAGGWLLASLGFGSCAPAAKTPRPRAQSSAYPFPTREQALERPNLVVGSGLLAAQYRIGSPPPNTTYDLRGLVSTAYPNPTTFPLSFGDDSPGLGTAVVGGTVLGHLSKDLTWQGIYEVYDSVGSGLLLYGRDYFVVYDYRADDVMDGFRPRSGNPDGAIFLIEGAYCTNIRDDCVENDQSLTGFIRDCLFDGVHMGMSLGQATSNPDAVTTIEDCIFAFKPFPNDKAPGGLGHGRIFKYFPGGGSVVMRNCIVYYEATPIDVEFTKVWPKGTYDNVVIVLGPRYDGDGDGTFTDLDHPGTLPRGVEQTRDVTVYERARQRWLIGHGYPGG